MASRSGGAPIRNLNKVRSGPDQAFTLQKGTSAAPIKGKGMGVQKVDITKKYKKEIAKLQKVLDKSARPKQKQTPKKKNAKSVSAKDLAIVGTVATTGLAAYKKGKMDANKANKKKKKKKLKTGPGSR